MFVINQIVEMMKAIVLLAAGLLTFSSVNAQQVKEKRIKASDVPEKVRTSFNEKYSNAKVEDWEKKGANYEADFMIDNVEMSALFDAQGNFKKSEQDIKVSELPGSASDYSSKKYPGYKLSEAEKIMDASGRVKFEVELSKGMDQHELIFDENGKFIEKSSRSKDKVHENK